MTDVNGKRVRGYTGLQLTKSMLYDTVGFLLNMF